MEYTIIRLFLKSKELYYKYITSINNLSIEREIKEIIKVIDSYYNRYPEHVYIAPDEFKVYFKMLHETNKNLEMYLQIIDNICQLDVSESLASDVVRKLIQVDYANKIVIVASPALSGEQIDVIPKIKELVTECELTLDQSEESNLFVSDDLDLVLNAEQVDPTLQWRLKCLNEHAPLHAGDLVHVYARPDIGKTTFLISELTGFAKSSVDDDDVFLWINNEERGNRLTLRKYCGVIGATKEQIQRFPDEARKRYHQNGGHKIKLYDNASITVKDIEYLIKNHQTRLCVIDQGDKIHFKGEDKGNGAARLTELYGYFRELAKTHNIPIITVGQAGSTAEGKKWLTLSDMDNSKTGKPGELDIAIGIGGDEISQEGLTEYPRYISLPKNKKGDKIRRQVIMQPHIARMID